MASKAPPTDLPIHAFASPAALEAFLDAHHETLPGFHLKIAKKSSGIPSVTAPEAVEVALCFGWIDGRGNGLDADHYLVRYTPRRAKSLWSAKNVDTVGRLTAEGKMRPAGQAAVDAAKADGRWERAYAGPATITVPDDLAAALEERPEAKAFFDGLNKSDRYFVLLRVYHASPKSRKGRVEATVKMLAEGKTTPSGKPAGGLKKSVPAKKRKELEDVDEGAMTKSAGMGAKVVKRSTKEKKAVTETPAPRVSRREGLRARP